MESLFKFLLQPASDIRQARIGLAPKGLKAPIFSEIDPCISHGHYA
jgi:hypothetical protein